MKKTQLSLNKINKIKIKLKKGNQKQNRTHINNSNKKINNNSSK